jgi:hypothetical protein
MCSYVRMGGIAMMLALAYVLMGSSVAGGLRGRNRP